MLHIWVMVSDNAVKKVQHLEGVIAPVLATYEGPHVSQSSTKGTEVQNRRRAAPEDLRHTRSLKDGS